MKKAVSVLFLLVMAFCVMMPMGLSEDASMGIIGGADGPTAIVVAETGEETGDVPPAEETQEEEGPKTQFGFYPDRFVDSLQYMLKGLVGIFLVTGLIILVLVGMDKMGNRKKKNEE